MTEATLDDLRYPVGRFRPREEITPAERAELIDRIASLPGELRKAVEGLSEEQLDAPYREGGWTVRQVVHHVADSHLNSYVRFRWTLTEDAPTIKPYEQEAWAQLHDARTAPVRMSLELLEAVHGRWVVLLRSLGDEAWRRRFRHPELGELDLEANLQLYAWHGRHHVAHVTGARERNGWA